MKRSKAAVVGAAETTQLGVIPNMSQVQLHADAALNAFGDVDQARPSSFPSATISLRATFLIFPLGVSGNASVRKYLAGILYLAIRLAQ